MARWTAALVFFTILDKVIRTNAVSTLNLWPGRAEHPNSPKLRAHVGINRLRGMREHTASILATRLALPEQPSIPAGLAPGQHVQIMGLFDTGTNLLRSLIEANFHGQVHVYDMYQPPKTYWDPEVLRKDRCFDEKPSGWEVCSFWKHANLEVLKARSPKRLRQMSDDDVVGIAMIREPLAWLQGVRKAPYDFGRGPNDVTHDDWLTRGFEASAGWYGGLPVERWTSLSAIWNNQSQSYSRLGEYGFKRHLVIRYEDLVTDTAGELRKIASVLGLPAPEVVVQVEESAKEGNSQGHDDAVSAIATGAYAAMFSDLERKSACDRLDASIMQMYDYSDCNHAVSEVASA